MWSQLFFFPAREFCRFGWGWLWPQQGETQQLLIKVQHTHISNRGFTKSFSTFFCWQSPYGVSTVRGKVFYGWKVFAVRQDLACWLPKGAGSTAVSQPCVLRTVSLPHQPELGFLSTGSKAEVPSLCTNTNPVPVHTDLNQRESNLCSQPTNPSLPHRCLLPFSVLFRSKLSNLHWCWSPQASNQCSNCSQ